MKNKKIIYLIGRDNWQKDIFLNNLLVEHLKKTGNEIRWEDPAGNMLYKLRRIENQLRWLPAFIRKINLRAFQIIYGLFHWSYFRYLTDRKNQELEFRLQKLKEDLSKFNNKKEVIILSRSSGGRFSSLIADSLNINHIICLGYPFKHPDKEIEPERYLHLETIQTPMLIIQGDKDEYGGLEIKDKYIFSPNVELLFVKASHNFNLDKQDWTKVLTKIDEIIQAKPKREEVLADNS